MQNNEHYIDKLLAGFSAGNRYSLARLITLVENEQLTMPDIRKRIDCRRSRAVRIGITGFGGVGKSSLIDRLISRIRQNGQTVGVIAVDPSSVFTGGALLGDRVRMQRHVNDDGVFIRSVASRGGSGGLSKKADEIIELIGVFGIDNILIETTGVGQTEVDIRDLADMVVLIIAPGYGDEIQLMKAGQLEIADIIVVNKANLDGAEELAGDIESFFMLKPDGVRPRVILAQATDNIGIEDLYGEMERQRDRIKK